MKAILQKLRSIKNADYIALSGITIIVVLFFFKLFYPQLSIFVTPDFGQSDLFQLNYPAKYALFDALHHNTLPLWNMYIGTGFPQLAEGQIGVFNLTNLILYKIFPFVVAINLTYMVVFLTAAIGTYVYCRYIAFTSLTSFLCSILFAFSGIFFTHASHINLIQASSYLPWAFLLTHAYINTKNRILIYLEVLVLSQQYFSGFPQVTLITLIGLIVFYAFHNKNNLQRASIYIAPLVLIILVASTIAIQFLPSKELLEISTRKDGFLQSQAAKYSFPWKHFAGFINPDIFGTPTNGTYPMFNRFGDSVFWENTGYIGIIPIMLALIALLHKKTRQRHKDYLLLLFISALLMTGKYSPIYFIFSFFPLNYFRAPSRFIILFVWSLVLISGFGFELLQKVLKKYVSIKYSDILLLIIICVSISQLLLYGYSYNPSGEASLWLQEQNITKSIPNDSRYYTVGSGLLWNSYFSTSGWSNKEPYIFMQNFTKPNSNVMYKKSSFEVYPILESKRFSYMSQLIDANISISPDSNIFTISDVGKRLLIMNNISTLISSLKNQELGTRAKLDSGQQTITSYQSDNPLPHAYIVSDYQHIDTVDDFSNKLSESQFDPLATVLLEKNIKDFSKPSENRKNIWSAKIVDAQHTNLSLRTTSTENGFLVVSDLFYPGWYAAIDGEETEIFAANLAQRAVYLPKGNHSVTFSYRPASFKIGLIISAAGHLLIGCLIFLEFFVLKNRNTVSNI
jgi:hypothetical protein